MASDARELIEAMPSSFLPEKAGMAKALIALDLSGDEGGQWVVDVANGQCEVREGIAEKPDVTVSMKAGDFVELVQGKLNAVQAFMTGRIKVSGNVAAVMQLMNWFKMG